jgi:hypothetical protein
MPEILCLAAVALQFEKTCRGCRTMLVRTRNLYKNMMQWMVFEMHTLQLHRCDQGTSIYVCTRNMNHRPREFRNKDDCEAKTRASTLNKPQ